MQIILLHSRSSARSVTLTRWHLILATAVFVTAVLAFSALFYYVALRHAHDLDLPFMREVVATATADEVARQDKYVKENLAAMATKLGQMQAQLMRLDALGERVQGLAGVKPQEFNFRQAPGRGGSEPKEAEGEPLSMSELQRALDAMASDVEKRADYMSVVETALVDTRAKARLLPTVQPVDVSYNASSFGWRIDPFTGRHTFHEGVDFAATVGTPIVAAAGGVVIAAEYHHQYGNMVDIDHGNNIVTRYAHASRLRVKVGDIVRRGQRIADVGTTGRSTGPHLHFEVLVNGTPQNPQKFLAAGTDQKRLLTLASK